MRKDELHWMQGSVYKYAKRKSGLGCDYVTKGWFFRDVQFDVVGYSNQKNEFHVVECKIGSKSTDVGHGFGQLLEYKAIIHQHGFDFLNEFNKRAEGKVELQNLRARTVPIYLYVGLTQDACRNFKLIEFMKKDGLEYVGILRVNDQGQCRPYIRSGGSKNYDICEAQLKEVPIERSFESAKEFFAEIERNLRGQLPSYLRNFRTEEPEIKDNSMNGYKKFWFENTTKPFHYEVHLHRDTIEVGLHMEADKTRNSALLTYLKKHKKSISDSLGRDVRFEKWANDWKRAYEEYRKNDLTSYTEDELETTTSRLAEYIKTLQPPG